MTGRHSLKSGYEFQHIATEVQDVNPLYGRDTYNGQFSRPAGIGANNSSIEPTPMRESMSATSCGVLSR